MSGANIKLTVIDGSRGQFEDKVLNLGTGQSECIIGRHSSCGLILKDKVNEISRIHARIVFQDGQLYISDLASGYGTYIDDQKLPVNKPCPLKKDDVVKICSFLLKFTDISFDGSAGISPSNGNSFNGSAGISPISPNQWTSGERTLRCIEVIDETHDVKTFRFVGNEPILFSSYKPGQFATLNLEIDGKKVKRSYSISSTPTRPHTLEITVKRVPPPSDAPDAPPGLVSNWLHDNITVGSEVKMKAPTGKFTCGENPAHKLLLISAGSGITPMMSMSRWLCDTGADVDIIFLHSARGPRDIIFRYELELMAAQHPNFKLAISKTRSEPGLSWYAYTGRLNEIQLQAIAPDFRERTVYLCGPNPFMDGVKSLLKGLNFPMENFYAESFGGGSKKAKKKPAPSAETPPVASPEPKPTAPAPAPVTPTAAATPPPAPTPKPASPSSNGSPLIVFSKSGKEVACDSGDIVLDVAEDEDIELDSGCCAGSCGTCELRLLEGDVNYEDEPEYECEPGYFLPCVATAAGRIVVEA